jgi:alkylhydroperoxidase family enzyme
MRLTPIVNSPSLLGKFLTFGMKRQLGRAVTPSQVIYNRVPAAWRIIFAIVRFDMFGSKLPQELRLLVTTHVAMLNGCEFCQDIKRAMAVRQKLGTEKFDALTDWRTSNVFNARERSALAFVEEATLQKHVSDATFDSLRACFDDREIAELTLYNAIENFYNLLNIPLEIGSDGLENIARDSKASVAAST